MTKAGEAALRKKQRLCLLGGARNAERESIQVDGECRFTWLSTAAKMVSRLIKVGPERLEVQVKEMAHI